MSLQLILCHHQRKKIKIEMVVDDIIEDSTASWLYNFGIQLLGSDRSTERLSDNHIDYAQEILKQQFPSIFGLQSTLLVSAGCCSRYTMTKRSLFLQIVYSKRRKHWIAVTARGEDSSVVVYDSVFSNIEDDTRKLCERWFGPRKVELGSCAQQKGDIDCGVYAIGFCVAVAHNKEPFFSTVSRLRQHIIECFEKLSFNPFP